MYKAVCSSTSSWHMLQYKAYVRTWIGYLRAGDSARPSRRAVKSWDAGGDGDAKTGSRATPHRYNVARLQAMPVPLSHGIVNLGP